jgi:hypothetical protein
MFEFTEKQAQDTEDFTFKNWLDSIIENAFLPGSGSQPLPCDDQGIAYL